MGLVTPDFGLVFWMVLSFSVVLYILSKFAWKPIMQSLKNRENSIQEALDVADRTKKEMAQLQSDNEKIMTEARQERDNLLKEARETKEKLINDAKGLAAIEANKMIEAAKQAIENEKIAAINEIKNQIAIFSVDIAEKLLKQELSKDTKQKEYITGLVNEIKLN
jgi:F-type H+-transporting ATPase subunit b